MTKLPSNILQCGLDTPAKRAALAAKYLLGATQPSPAVEVVARKLKGSITPASAPGVVPIVAANPPADVPAVLSKVVTPDPKFIGSVSIDDSNAAYTKINCVLPVAPSALAVGATMSSALVGEISTPGLDLGNYIAIPAGTVATATPYPVGYTFEKMLFDAVNDPTLPVVPEQTKSIKTALYAPTATAPKIAVVAIEFFLGK